MPRRSRSMSRSRSRGRAVRARFPTPSRSISSVSRRGAVRRTPRMMNTHYFSRYALTSGFPNLSITTAAQSVSHTFRFDDMVNYTEFTSLFDQYHILKVIVTYRLITNPDANTYTNATTGVNGTNWYPSVWYIADYDDDLTENIDELKERIGVKNRILMPNKPVRFVVRPKVNVQTYRTLTTTGYAPKSMPIDCSQVNVPHYGLKTCIDCAGFDPVDTIPFVIQQQRQYFFKMTNVR